MKRSIIMLLCAGILLSGCDSSSVDSNIKAKVNAEEAAKEPVFIMAGKVEAATESEISPKITGRVEKVLVDIGSNVKKGDVIVTLESQELMAQLDQAQAGVRIAQANLEKGIIGARPEQKAQAQASLESELKNYENAKKNYERIGSLFKDGAVSQSELDSAEVKLSSAQARYDSAGEQVRLLGGESKETIKVISAQLDQAKAAYDAAKSRVDEASIKAPVSGVITAMNVDLGETVTSSTKLLKIVNSGSLSVSAYMPSGFSGNVKVGQTVDIKVSEIPDEMFSGEVTAIDPAIDDSRGKILVKVLFDEKGENIKPGMFAKIGLEL